MRTAALLPAPGNPYLVDYWLRHFEQVWQDEVDELHVHVNQQPDSEVRAWIQRRVEEAGARYSERTGSSTHGVALGDLILGCDTDVVVLCEDDAFVRQPGAVTRRLDRIRSGHVDVIAAPRGSMTKEVEATALKRWGPTYSKDGGSGHGMWPAFVFARRDVLLATDRNFDSVAWPRGDLVMSLGLTVTSEIECADTFGSMAFQLRNSCRVENDVQYKGPYAWNSWLDADHDIPWFHVGSLSSSDNLACEHELAGGLSPVTSEDALQWAHRLHWWRRVLDTAGPDTFPKRQDTYRVNWERLRATLQVPEELVRSWDGIVSRMVTWDET